MSAKPTAPISGHIDANSIYTLDGVKHHVGLGVHAMRTARRKGLVVRRIGSRGFVLGRDLIEFIERQGKTS